MRQTVKTHEITCDAKDCYEFYRSRGGTMSSARWEARRQGWASNELKDWCPKHR